MKSFDEIFVDKTKYGTKLKTSEYMKNGKYIIIDQGQKDVAGYTDIESGVFTDVPAIIFGDHTRIIKYVDKQFFLGADGVKVLKSKDRNANYKYLYYALVNVKIPNTGYNRHFKWLKESKFFYPDYEQQKKIAHILDKVTELIDKRKQQLEKLDELVKSRFVEMFGSGGYETTKLKNVCTKITDGTHKTPNYVLEGIRFISAKNIINNELDFSDIKYISKEEYAAIQKRCQTEIYDILLSKSGSLGSPAILRTNEPIGLFESLAIIKYNRCKLLPEFLCEQLKTEEIQRQFKSGTKGVAIKHLHLNVIGNIDIIVPPLGLQTQFAAFVEQVNKSKSEVKQALEKSETLKKALMQKYFG